MLYHPGTKVMATSFGFRTRAETHTEGDHALFGALVPRLPIGGRRTPDQPCVFREDRRRVQGLPETRKEDDRGTHACQCRAGIENVGR